MLFIILVVYINLIERIVGLRETGSKQLSPGLVFGLTTTGPFQLDYRISCVGGNMDIYLFSKEAYDDWTNEETAQAQFIAGGSSVNTNNTTVSYEETSDGVFHLIMYNPMVNAILEVNYDVNFDLSSSNQAIAWTLLSVVIAVLFCCSLCIVYVVYVMLKRKGFNRQLCGKSFIHCFNPTVLFYRRT